MSLSSEHTYIHTCKHQYIHNIVLTNTAGILSRVLRSDVIVLSVILLLGPHTSPRSSLSECSVWPTLPPPTSSAVESLLYEQSLGTGRSPIALAKWAAKY